MTRSTIAILGAICGMAAVPCMAATATTPCSAATLSGPYEVLFGGRIISASGALNGVFEAVGTANFDGLSKVTITGTINTLAATGQSFNYSGTYTLPASCFGTLTLTSGRQASFSLVAWASGGNFSFTGTDGNTSSATAYVWNGSGTNATPTLCGTPSVSGQYTYQVTGNINSSGVETDAANESGALNFDGQGNVTASYTVVSSLSSASTGSGTGAYTVNQSCSGSATIKDSVSGATRTLNFTIAGSYGQNLRFLESTSGFIGSGTGHNAFSNPSQSIANVANYAYSATPPGSVFVLFGQNLATKAASAQNVPLPYTLQSASVTVNGEPAPLFYADTGQIDAQMPLDIPGNSVAAVVVKSGSALSNAAAVYVPAAATPGLSVSPGTNQAVIVNQDQVTVNTSKTPAAVNDEVTMYFTGGGPVTPSGKWSTGAASPAGLSPVTDPNPTITVGGVPAKVVYVGLTPGSVGLYQANFNVPQVAKGNYPVVLTISGTASNSLLGAQNPNPIISVSN